MQPFKKFAKELFPLPVLPRTHIMFDPIARATDSSLAATQNKSCCRRSSAAGGAGVAASAVAGVAAGVR